MTDLSERSSKDDFLAAFRAEVERVGRPEEGHDNEIEHSRADDLMVLALRAAGWGDVADLRVAWEEKVGFWYA